MAPASTIIEADCATLLLRALLNQTVAAFGDDGLGKHGTCPIPQYYKIVDVDVTIGIIDSEALGCVRLLLEGYDSADHGDIFTDKNFLISVRKLLQEHHIDQGSVKYGELVDQGENFVTLELDVGLLLDWA
jgi:hypothetical protein